MGKETEITICLGSSCFSRGNGKTLKIIENYLKNNNIRSEIFFHGELCTGNCEKGPIMKIDETLYEGVTPDNVTDILDEYFK